LLQKHPAPPVKNLIEILPMDVPYHVRQQLDQGTLSHTSEKDIAQQFVEGKLSCRWSDSLVWESIRIRLTEYETSRAQQMEPVSGWRQEQQDLEVRRDDLQQQVERLQKELSEITEKHKDIGKRIEERVTEVESMADLSELLSFAKRVSFVEQRLVSKLEEEMNKQNPVLAAQSDETSPQPKLSLLLNCMGVQEAAIVATRDLDSALFKRRAKRHELFAEEYNQRVPASGIKDLLYVAEMLGEAQFPFSDHDEECVVCANHTAAQMINFVNERKDINLPVDELKRLDINGKRALFCTSKDFPSMDPEQVRTVLHLLNDIHEEALLE